MMGVAADVHDYIFGDNKYVIYKIMFPDSMLNNKSQIIAYQLVKERSGKR